MKLSPTEQTALNRKAILSMRVSPDTKNEVMRRDLEGFTKDVLKVLTTKRHLKNFKLFLVETEEEK